MLIEYMIGGKIKCVTLCENSHSVASGSDNGSVHVFRVEYATKQDSSLNRYTGFATIHNVTSSDEGGIIGIQHYNTIHHSLLAYGTTKCRIHGLDLRMQKEAWMLNNSLNMGLLSCFLIEPNRNWMVTGTNSGYYTCWDLRFQ